MRDLKTGDILYRKGDSRGPFNIPVSKLIAVLTDSYYSHASIVLKEGNVTYVVEVSENGTDKITLEKWECWCVENFYSVYRLNQKIDENKVRRQIDLFLKLDPDYDSNFDDPNKSYCTESVAEILFNAGYYNLFTPKKIKDIITFRIYCIMYPLNFVVKTLTGKGLPMNKPLYFVGNEKKGMLSSNRLHKVKDVYL